MNQTKRMTVTQLTENKMEQIAQTLAIYKKLLPLWNEVSRSGDPQKIKRFLSLNRNPIFDITGTNYFRTGMISKDASKCERCDMSHDHIIQRSKSLEYIFNELEKKPKMTVKQFAKVLRRYCSTLVLTKDEHRKMTTYARLNPSYSNASLYEDLGIKITGLNSWLRKNKLIKVSTRQY